MADNRKEQERDELHRTIWGIANDLRGSVDGWDFKQYVLGMRSTVIFPRTLQTTSTTASAKRATQRLTTPSFLTAMRSRPEMTSSKRKAFSSCRASCFAASAAARRWTRI